MSSTTPESMNGLRANSTTISVMILVPNDKTKEMLVQELFLWHFGSEAPCTVHRCRIDGPEPYMDNVNVVEMVLEFGDRRAADATHPGLRAWTLPNVDEDSCTEIASDSNFLNGLSSDEERLEKTKIRRNNDLICTATETGPDGSRVESFQSMMKESFNNAILSDVTIFVNGLRFAAHSFVLASQCKLFKDVFTTGGLKKEATKEFRYKTKHPHAYWRMLEYMYKGTYSIEPAAEIAKSDDDLIHRHIHVFAVAEAFDIQGLQRLACDRFQQSILQDRMDIDFVACVRLIYKTTKKRGNLLRTEVMEIVCGHSKELWKLAELQKLVSDGGDFTVDFMAKLLEGN
ncbi:BTB POZ fold domain containing [Cordyceps militaris]|uniref:BTB POZ fold domain containing n=1 Tax=Cordyceps militaris TaxID=73501 RepID=A0A2H4S6K7_CORMI|nr:BTB POZ fold domain containing [Cordyceps militaris]